VGASGPTLGATIRHQSRRSAVGRVWVLADAAAVAAADLGLKAWAPTGLPVGGLEAGPVGLRLMYNPGVAFSVADGAPAAALIVGTGLLGRCGRAGVDGRRAANSRRNGSARPHPLARVPHAPTPGT